MQSHGLLLSWVDEHDPSSFSGACGQGVGRSGRIARFSQGKWWFESSQENRLPVHQFNQDVAMTWIIVRTETNEVVDSQDRSGMIQQIR